MGWEDSVVIRGLIHRGMQSLTCAGLLYVRAYGLAGCLLSTVPPFSSAWMPQLEQCANSALEPADQGM